MTSASPQDASGRIDAPGLGTWAVPCFAVICHRVEAEPAWKSCAVSQSDSDQTNTETTPALEVAKPALQVTLCCDSFWGFLGGFRQCVVFNVDVRSSSCQRHGLGRLEPAPTSSNLRGH